MDPASLRNRRFDTIIFDLDGVIIDSEPLWDVEISEFLSRRGIAYDRDAVKHHMTGKALHEGVRFLQSLYSFPGDVEGLTLERIESIGSLFDRSLDFVSGFADFFDCTRGRFKSCVATSMDRRLLPRVVARLGLQQFFGVNIFSIADVGGVSKPNPDLFLFAARRLGSTPARCIVIEDAPSGIEAARRAGMFSIALARTHTPDQLSAADLVAETFSEIELDGLAVRVGTQHGE